MASKVFAKLFEAHIPKGTAFNDRMTYISVPEEPDGMKIMLEFLHFCPRPARLHLCQLEKLAAVALKYRAQPVFATPANVWMKERLDDQGLSYDLPRYLSLGVIFKSFDIVNIVSIGLALTTGYKWNDSTIRKRVETIPLGRCVPDEIINHTESMRSKYHIDLLHVLAGLPSKMIGKPPDGALAHSQLKHSRHYIETAYHWFRAVQESEIMVDSTRPILQQLFQLCALAKRVIELDRNISAAQPPGGKCTAYKFVLELRARLFFGIVVITNDQFGACLKCKNQKGEESCDPPDPGHTSNDFGFNGHGIWSEAMTFLFRRGLGLVLTEDARHGPLVDSFERNMKWAFDEYERERSQRFDEILDAGEASLV